MFGRTIDYVLNNLPCEAIINVIPKTTGTAGSAAGGIASAGMIPPTVVPPASGAAAAAGVRQGAAGGQDAARPGGVKRRAQGLPLSRYVPARPGQGGPDAREGDGGGVAPRQAGDAPDKDGGGRDDPGAD